MECRISYLTFKAIPNMAFLPLTFLPVNLWCKIDAKYDTISLYLSSSPSFTYSVFLPYWQFLLLLFLPTEIIRRFYFLADDVSALHCCIQIWAFLPCPPLLSYIKLIWELGYSPLLDCKYAEDKRIHFLMPRWVKHRRLYQEGTQNP